MVLKHRRRLAHGLRIPALAALWLGAQLGAPQIGLAQTLTTGDAAGAKVGEAAQPATERLSGHGGPVKGLAVHLTPSGDGSAAKAMALTASFDNALGFWDGASGERLFWLEGHDAAVNSVAFTPNGAAAVSGSDDFTVRYWYLQEGLSVTLSGHRGKVAQVAVSPDGAMAASASWDGSIGLWRLPQSRTEQPVSLGYLEGHQGAVNAVAFSADGQTLLSGGADGRVLRWRIADGAMLRPEAQHGFSVNVIALPRRAAGQSEEWLAYGAADGVVRIVNLADGAEIAALSGDRRPILSLSLSPSGARMAYGDGQGYISTVPIPDDIAESNAWRIERDFRAAARGPIWALAWLDEERLLAAGLDESAAVWPVTGAASDAAARELLASKLARFHVDPGTVTNGERQFARKCSICHALTEGHARRAGPSLYGLFGRKIGTAPGYTYSPELTEMDIIWSEETVDKLFDLGPETYTPGSKMPQQRITAAQDRADLIAYLKAVTAPNEKQE